MKSHRSRAIGFGWLLTGLVWLPTHGWARAPERVAAPRRAPSKRSVVMLAARNQANASKELHQAVSGQLSDASVALELHWVSRFAARPPAQLAQARKIAKGRRIVVVFWCDLSAKGEIFLYLVEPGKGRLIMRSVAQAGGGGRAESVAIIVGMSVRAILGSLRRPRPRPRPRDCPRGARRSRSVASVHGSRPGEISAQRPVMPLTADNPLFAEAARLKMDRPPRAPHWLTLEMGYALDFYGKKQMASGATYPPSHGASIGLTARFAKRWGAFVSFRVIEPIKAKGDTVHTSLQRYPLSTGARIRFRLGRWVELGGALSFTFDYVAVDTKAPEGWTALANQNELHYLIGGEVRLAFLVVDRLRILFVLGAEVGLNPIMRTIEQGDAGQPIIIDPWPVQPYFRLGISLDMI
jgi:hypothetical protein